MPKVKKVTLNKAAAMLKKTKEKQELSSMLRTVVMYPIDTINATDPKALSQLLISKVNSVVKDSIETKDAIMLYSQIKESIIKANVESGLHHILCQMDMFKNMKKYLEIVLSYEATTMVSDGHQRTSCTLLEEDVLGNPDEFKAFVNSITADIVRQDSKNNSINAIVNMTSMNKEYIEEALKNITIAMNDLEDQKYEINNSYKIEIVVPDSLCEYFGI